MPTHSPRLACHSARRMSWHAALSGLLPDSLGCGPRASAPLPRPAAAPYASPRTARPPSPLLSPLIALRQSAPCRPPKPLLSQVASSRVKSRQVASSRVKSRQVTSCRVKSRQVAPSRVKSRQVTSCQVRLLATRPRPPLGTAPLPHPRIVAVRCTPPIMPSAGGGDPLRSP